MKSAMPFYGVSAPLLKQITRECFSSYPLTDFSQWQDTILALWRQAKYHEERYAAIALCNSKLYLPYQTLATVPVYEEMIVTGAWWDVVDGLAPYRFRHLLTIAPQPTRQLLLTWAKCDNLWKRRAAIIAQLKRKEATDLTLLYACIEPSLGSKEFFLQKAIGWALRDYAWLDIAEVERYVHANSVRLATLSQREALKNRAKLVG